jgi:TPR repeat protein
MKIINLFILCGILNIAACSDEGVQQKAGKSDNSRFTYTNGVLIANDIDSKPQKEQVSDALIADSKYPNVPAGVFRDGLLASDRKDFVTALEKYKIAGQQGNMIALHNIGYMYYTGNGVEKNFVEAAYWYKLSAEGGYVGAQESIADMYKRGEGVQQNDAEYFRWLSLASAQGSSRATNLLRSINR